jgi:hypothetical protein
MWHYINDAAESACHCLDPHICPHIVWDDSDSDDDSYECSIVQARSPEINKEKSTTKELLVEGHISNYVEVVTVKPISQIHSMF